MDRKTLASLRGTELADYLWHRLRLEEPVSPPLDHRFRDEAPEEIFIDLLRDTGEAEFRAALIGAMRDNLTRLLPLLLAEAGREPAGEQISSLGFLADAIEAQELLPDLHAFATTLWFQARGGNTAVHPALYHLLEAVGTLQQTGALKPFWEEVADHAPDPGLRGIAWYGLAKAAPEAVPGRLEKLIEDPEIDLPIVAWNLATEQPGLPALALAARRLTAEQKERLRAALAEAGADAAMLSRLDGPPSLFRFPQPRHAAPAPLSRPLWHPKAKAA